MHRTLHGAAGALAAGVVLVVAAHSAGAAAGTPSTGPSCEVVRDQVRAAADAREAAVSRQLRLDAASVQDGTVSADERAARRVARTTALQRRLQVDALVVASPRCFDAGDVELARASVQQLAPELTQV